MKIFRGRRFTFSSTNAGLKRSVIDFENHQKQWEPGAGLDRERKVQMYGHELSEKPGS
jgi:hypothetical protein